MKSRTIMFTTAGSVVLAIALLAACADSISAGYDPPPPPPAPTLVEPESKPPVFDAGMCISYECPAPYATCPGKLGLCTANLQLDLGNCGACGNACAFTSEGANANASLACLDGKCEVKCGDGFGDCNGKYEDGCETAVERNPQHCGACGNTCKAGEVCWRGACGCPPGYAQCGDTCTQLDRDARNCSACGTVCGLPDEDAGAGAWPCGPGVVPPNIGPACVSSACKLDCAPGYLDCNTDRCGDGCETFALNDPKNCGGCGIECSAEQSCVMGKCQCADPAFAACGGCVDLQTDIFNCGACGNVCPGLQSGVGSVLTGNPVCVLGRCSYYCPPGRADCDNRIDNGCEVDTMIDPLNCGGCGVQCELDGGQPCAAGQCLTKPCPIPDAGGGVF